MNFPYIFLTAAYCLLIYSFSADPDPPLPEWDFRAKDKVLHAIAYGGLAAIVSVGLRKSDRLVSHRVQWLVPMLFAAIYGISDEIHQAFVPLRTFSYLDMAADTFGAVLIQFYLCRRRWRIPFREA